MASGDDLLGSVEAGRILGVKKRQLIHLINQGVLTAKKVGNAYIIRRSDLSKVPKNRKPGPKPKPKPAKK